MSSHKMNYAEKQSQIISNNNINLHDGRTRFVIYRGNMGLQKGMFSYRIRRAACGSA